MKIRKGYVSNSSSSSFIVIGRGEMEKNLTEFAEYETLVLGDKGNTEFGWEHTEYHDMWSRINFAYLQTKSGGDRVEWLEMLETTIKEAFNCSAIVWLLDDDYGADKKRSPYGHRMVWGYIDHQSAACEGENTEMFDDMDSLKRFLFCHDSYIQGDNDNRSYDD